jgi:hypothetical protein
MREVSLGQRISWFLYQQGLSAVARPAYLHIPKFADPDWFKVAEVLIKDNNLEGRRVVLEYVLQGRNFTSHPKRSRIIRLVAYFLNKGILDERRKVVRFINDNTRYFNPKDEILIGPLMMAQRDSDMQIANTAESAFQKLMGV